jgi:acyl dehydratase
MTCIENRIFDEIAVGESASLSRTLSWKDIELFAAMSGDVNPAHMDEEFAKSDMFHKIIAHGMWGGALISTVLGTELPGPGTIYVGQTLHFRRPIGLGDTVTVRVTASGKDAAKRRVTFQCEVTNQKGETVIEGTAEVMAPTRKICRDRIPLPEVEIHEPEGGKPTAKSCPAPAVPPAAPATMKGV